MSIPRLLHPDRAQSVLSSTGPQGYRANAYDPFGYRRPALAGVAFNGQWRETLTGHYPLGNGHRSYHPVLRRFASPDALSPFGAAGVSAYAYCKADPINATDPTGTMGFLFPVGIVALVGGIVLNRTSDNSWLQGLGIVLAVGGGILAVSSLAIGAAGSSRGRRDSSSFVPARRRSSVAISENGSRSSGSSFSSYGTIDNRSLSPSDLDLRPRYSDLLGHGRPNYSEAVGRPIGVVPAPKVPEVTEMTLLSNGRSLANQSDAIRTTARV